MPKLKTPSAEPKTASDFRGANGARKELYTFVQRVERLTEEISGLTEDRKEVMSEAKARGYDTKILNIAIRRRRLDKGDREEADSILELYETELDAAEKAELAQSEAEAE